MLKTPHSFSSESSRCTPGGISEATDGNVNTDRATPKQVLQVPPLLPVMSHGNPNSDCRLVLGCAEDRVAAPGARMITVVCPPSGSRTSCTGPGTMLPSAVLTAIM